MIPPIKRIDYDDYDDDDDDDDYDQVGLAAYIVARYYGSLETPPAADADNDDQGGLEEYIDDGYYGSLETPPAADADDGYLSEEEYRKTPILSIEFDRHVPVPEDENGQMRHECRMCGKYCGYVDMMGHCPDCAMMWHS